MVSDDPVLTTNTVSLTNMSPYNHVCWCYINSHDCVEFSLVISIVSLIFVITPCSFWWPYIKTSHCSLFSVCWFVGCSFNPCNCSLDSGGSPVLQTAFLFFYFYTLETISWSFGLWPYLWGLSSLAPAVLSSLRLSPNCEDCFVVSSDIWQFFCSSSPDTTPLFLLLFPCFSGCFLIVPLSSSCKLGFLAVAWHLGGVSSPIWLF